MTRSVLITTSGIGNRLGELTRFTNKSLVAVGDKPAISRIIELYPKDTRFVVTIGYQAVMVREFLEIAYPHKIFDFVYVDKFDGPGSSLGFSMLQASRLLQTPFVFHASDTLLAEPIPDASSNWLGGFVGNGAAEYTSFDCRGEVVVNTHPKGQDNFDYLYIGVAGIHSYAEFWEALNEAYSENPFDSSLNDITAIQNLIENQHRFELKLFQEWEDIGNVKSLSKARDKFPRELETLEKNDEDIFKIQESVVKYFASKDVCSKRIERGKLLYPAVPTITTYNSHYYRYAYVEGKIASDGINSHLFTDLLEWANINIWRKKVSGISKDEFQKRCLAFYFDKTDERVRQYFKKTGHVDGNQSINGLKVPTMAAIILMLQEEEFGLGHPSVIHGDFILDNIIKTEKDFVAIDWRQDFAGLIETGDLYYDLAKLNHSLTMNHRQLKLGKYKCKVAELDIQVDIIRQPELVECEKVLEEFVKVQGFNMRKVKLLTALVWINMSPLHAHPLDIFLFNFGKQRIWEILNEE
jgi:choline kinase